MNCNYKGKKRIVVSQEDFDTAIRQEVQKRYNRIDADISAQILAVVLVTLELNYGWKQVRLRRFVDNLHATATLADDTDIFGKKTDTKQFLEHLGAKYGIDLRHEVSKM